LASGKLFLAASNDEQLVLSVEKQIQG